MIAATLAGGAAAWAAGGSPPACGTLKADAQKTLRAPGTVRLAPVSYPGLPDAPGCKVTFRGTGATFGASFQAVAARLDAMLRAGGWTRDPAADADGPTGTATGYRKAAQLATVSVEYQVAPGVCPVDMPIASCRPAPRQKAYQIVLGVRPAE